ncbi:MAG: hypothetical protein D6736_05735 [Nitrospinota bacterium]|nr:MAG: hypothetical protein D6736_05735 [Nitrospinota bacterium]
MRVFWSGLCLLVLAAWLTGCPGTGSEEQSFTINIRNRAVQGDMDVLRVKQGDRVTLWWMTDETVTIHLHGYDIEQVVKPGVSSVFTFQAYATGRYPITAHAFGNLPAAGDQQEIPLLYLEVLPR